jgi:hypothetical protein
MALIVWCSTDFFGNQASGNRAKARNEAEILDMKGQLFVTQLPLLLEQRTAQHRLRRQSPPPGLAQPVAAQIAGHQAHQRALTVQPLRDGLQLTADLVPRKDLEYSGLDGAFLTHCRLRRCGLRFGFNGMHPQPTRNRRALPALIRDSLRYSKSLWFMDGH